MSDQTLSMKSPFSSHAMTGHAHGASSTLREVMSAITGQSDPNSPPETCEPIDENESGN